MLPLLGMITDCSAADKTAQWTDVVVLRHHKGPPQLPQAPEVEVRRVMSYRHDERPKMRAQKFTMHFYWRRIERRKKLQPYGQFEKASYLGK